jgi:hypothetical protein
MFAYTMNHPHVFRIFYHLHSLSAYFIIIISLGLENRDLLQDSEEGTRQRSWLRYYVPSWKVAGSIHNKVTAFFN